MIEGSLYCKCYSSIICLTNLTIVVWPSNLSISHRFVAHLEEVGIEAGFKKPKSVINCAKHDLYSQDGIYQSADSTDSEPNLVERNWYTRASKGRSMS